MNHTKSSPMRILAAALALAAAIAAGNARAEVFTEIVDGNTWLYSVIDGNQAEIYKIYLADKVYIHNYLSTTL